MIIIAILLSLAAGIGLAYLVLRPKLRAVQQYDEKIFQENEELKEKNKNLNENRIWLESETNRLQSETSKLLLQKDSTNEQIQTLHNSISAMEQQAQEAADLFYKSKMQTACESLEQALELEAQKYQDLISNFQVEYDETIAELVKQYKALADNVSIMKQTNDAAVAAAKRAEEMKDSQNYYRIQLTEADVKEIELLRSIEPYLREKEPLNKVIWKCYYEKPTTDMIGRVVGSGVHTGIYKITEIESGKCYVGQGVDLKSRWIQHIKRGVGAETPTRNKLYPAMIAAGPENFTFEVIEECSRAALDDREDYWQDYFSAKEFGYSIK